MRRTLRNIWQFVVKHLSRDQKRLEDQQWLQLRKRWRECVELSRGFAHDPEWLVARKAAVIDDVCDCLQTNDRVIAVYAIDNPWIDLLDGGTFAARFSEDGPHNDFLVVAHGIDGLRYYFARDELVDDHGLKVNLLSSRREGRAAGKKQRKK